MRRKTWAIAAVAALAGMILGAAAVFTWQRVRPRLPDLAAVTPVLDRAIAEVISDAGDGAAVTVSGLVASASCEHTFLAKGAFYTRTANLYTDPGGEAAVIDRIAAAMPANEHPSRTGQTPSGVPSLAADLGDGIRLQVAAIGEGWLVATARTDCRAGNPSPPATDPTDTELVNQLLTALGATPATFHTESVACPSGRIVTLDAISQPTAIDHLPDRMAALIPTTMHRFASTSNRVAWRDQTSSTIVAASDDGTRITVQRTTTC